MNRQKTVFRIFTITIIGVIISGCTNQQGVNSSISSKSNKTEQALNTNDSTDKKVVNETSTSISSNSNSSSTEQPQSTNVSIDKEGIEETYYGQWEIEKVLAFGPVGAYSNDDIKTIIGKKLVFSKESASCFGDQIESLNNTAHNPIYKKVDISKNDFESNYRVTFDQLGINGDSVTEVEVSDTKGICTVFFITPDNDKLILYGGGTFFELDIDKEKS